MRESEAIGVIIAFLMRRRVELSRRSKGKRNKIHLSMLCMKKYDQNRSHLQQIKISTQFRITYTNVHVLLSVTKSDLTPVVSC